MTNIFKNEKRLRRNLLAEGFRLWKVRRNSSYFLEYGPYAVIDISTDMVLVSGAELSDVRRWFEG